MGANDSRAERIAGLSPERRAALERLIREQVARGTDLRRPEGVPVPLSYAQQRLWLLDQIRPDNAAYNETNTLRLQFPLDLAAFRAAVHEIVRRHEPLRMSVRVVDGTPCQDFHPSVPLDIPVVDLRHFPPADREAEAVRLAVEQSSTPFRLDEAPLLRASLCRLDTADHLFALTIHHLVCDGWSMGVFMVELVALYWSFAAGRPSPLPELATRYSDYAAWQRRALAGSEHAQLVYWRERLRDLPTLQLPTDRPRPAEFTFRGARRPLEISGATYTAVSGLAERHNVTPFMVLFAAFAALLHRYTEQEDIPIGAPSAGRSRKELEPLIGFFVNTLVLRVKVAGTAPFLEVLDEVRRASTEAFANQDVPFERLVEDLLPRRDLSRNPLFQVTFQLFTRPSTTGLAPEVLLPFTPVDTGISKFDLSVALGWTEQAFRGHVEYCTDLFDAGRIDRMVGHYLRLLEGVTADPTRRMCDYSILTPAEERQLVVEWNRTAADYPQDRTIPEVFREQLDRAPDAPAVRFAGRTATYRQLGESAAVVSAELAAQGVRPGDLVGLYLDRGAELPAALLGILGAGAGYVPLDPGYPAERTRYLLRDSGVRAVLTTTGRASDLAGFDGAVVAIDRVADPRPAVPALGTSPTDVAYVMYTSGTTGRPKGVAVTHRNVLRLVKGVTFVAFGPDEVVLQFAPLSFDASTFEVWGCLLNGGTLVVHPPGVPSLDELGAFIRSERVSLLFLTTSLFAQMVEHCPAALRGVGQVVTGGEEMFPPLARAAWQALPRSLLINAYGPTECTCMTMAYPVTRPEAVGDAVPIGRPFENTTAYVLDRYGNPVPVGVAGELHVGGDGVAVGYWQRPELTAERFVPDPFVPGGRLYRTGDVACYREDGNLLFLGRRDRQVKLSGYRIELGEVEAAVLSHPDVSAAAVVLAGSGDDRRLAGFYQPHQGHTVSPDAMRAYLAQRLPQYMIPSVLDAVDPLPLTPNGKVDAAALAGRASGTSAPREGFVAARTAAERAVAAIWAEVLRTERVGVTDNFFELGGQSLLATRILSRIRTASGARITAREFFDHPTVEGLARLVAARSGPEQSPAVVGAGSSE
jgi:amino acid adenylation domain-containing protein